MNPRRERANRNGHDWVRLDGLMNSDRDAGRTPFPKPLTLRVVAGS